VVMRFCLVHNADPVLPRISCEPCHLFSPTYSPVMDSQHAAFLIFGVTVAYIWYKRHRASSISDLPGPKNPSWIHGISPPRINEIISRISEQDSYGGGNVRKRVSLSREFLRNMERSFVGTDRFWYSSLPSGSTMTRSSR
jgi:hypothetical protein